MQRHVTSVFSEYDAMENNSANSKQLEYWLKQISSPVPTNNLGFQWTFMSNQSSHVDRNSLGPHPLQQLHDAVSFGKTVHSSIERDKENNSSLLNVPSRNSTESKSKSYVNAMIALQKKVKTLEDENSFMRKNITKINQERAQSMTESSVAEEQLKSRLKLIEPKLVKMDELIESNKILREAKEERTRKIKILQKSNSELKAQNSDLMQRIEDLHKQSNQHKMKAEGYQNKLGELDSQIKKLAQRNKILEDMKEKSTVSLLQKYNKSIEMVESMEKENVKLKNQINYMKNKFADQMKNIQQVQSDQIKKYLIEFQKLKESISLKNSLIQQKKKEADYFREAYEKKGEEFMELVRSHHKLIEQDRTQIKVVEVEKSNTNRVEPSAIKENTMRGEKIKQNEKSPKQKQVEKPQQIKLQNYGIVDPNSKQSSVVRMPETLIQAQSPPGKRSFEGFDSEQDEFDESAIPVPVQTKSVGKPMKRKKRERKAVLSSQSRRDDSKKKNQQSSVHYKNAASPRQHRKIVRKRNNVEKEDASFTMKSCEAPKTQPLHKITFEADMQQDKQNRIANSYYYTAQYPPLPHRINGGQEIQDFHHKNNISAQSIDEAMLIELQKQLLQLYEEQENLILASNDQYASQAERSEYVGRLKQINEHLRVKNQKICELKSKI